MKLTEPISVRVIGLGITDDFSRLVHREGFAPLAAERSAHAVEDDFPKRRRRNA